MSEGKKILTQIFPHSYYLTTDSELVRRIPHVDIFTFVSAVGGSLGMFLGFSFANCLWEVILFAASITRKTRDRTQS